MLYFTVFNTLFNTSFNTHLLHIYYVLTDLLNFIYSRSLHFPFLPFTSIYYSFITLFITIRKLGIFITIYSIYYKWCFSLLSFIPFIPFITRTTWRWFCGCFKILVLMRLNMRGYTTILPNRILVKHHCLSKRLRESVTAPKTGSLAAI